MMANEESNTSSRIDEHEQVYDVFLNFIRSDTQMSFSGNLFNALRSKRFKTFMYNDSFRTGKQISFTVVRALKRSRIAIVVLSKDYPKSVFCLQELVMILKLKLLVFPIFYEVDPSEVRYQKGSYGDIFADHENRHKLEKLEIWRSALYGVSCIRGLHFKNRVLEKCEYEIIQEAVEWVSNTMTRYGVFLSSKEEDTRYSFCGYLYNALNQEGFKIFMNDNGCKEEGTQSSHSLVTTLKKSRLSIIVLSKNFAYSSLCLDELVTILDFMKNNQLLVWPIFYKVEPTDIRHQKNSYEKAMSEHENKYGKDSKKVKMWRLALFEVANLKGWHLKYGYEYELIEKIVEMAIKI
ncbi:probable disease resistance protein At4g19530 isoform X2 [Vicia villosa]|uniref:probable disease resistance protein At4g19530 isoform X2 n=1 Tax=Vicia villosa TaxID=3911 RepID=UPI00273B2E8E|nr:probable disease resistance protein At4g19530 isoform X2 [Vicia villosa]